MPRYVLEDCFIKSYSTSGSAESEDSFDFVGSSDEEAGDRGFQDLEIKPPPKPRDDFTPELSLSSDAVPDADAPELFHIDFIV